MGEIAGAAGFEVAAFPRIRDHVEQEFVVADLQIFQVAERAARCAFDL